MDISYGNGPSPGGFKYCLLLVDYCTRYSWLYGLPSLSSDDLKTALLAFFLDAG